MAEITLLASVSEKDQNDFYSDKYKTFLSNALYGYLFLGSDLREIEREYLNTNELLGFFSKGVLNMMGIDTSRKSKNRGKYHNMKISEVVPLLMSRNDVRLNNIGYFRK